MQEKSNTNQVEPSKELKEELKSQELNPNDLILTFNNKDKKSVLIIDEGDVDKVAKFLYEICIDNKIKATFVTTNK